METTYTMTEEALISAAIARRDVEHHGDVELRLGLLAAEVLHPAACTRRLRRRDGEDRAAWQARARAAALALPAELAREQERLDARAAREQARIDARLAAERAATARRLAEGRAERLVGRLAPHQIGEGEVALVSEPGDPYTARRTWVGTPAALRARAAERPGRLLGERCLSEAVAELPAAR